MSEAYNQMWLSLMGGIQISNPLGCVILNSSDLPMKNPLREKYKNFDLPDNFSDDELVELDEWIKIKEL